MVKYLQEMVSMSIKKFSESACLKTRKGDREIQYD